jgi:hypothetical protein
MFGDRFSKATGLSLAAFIALVVGLQWDSFFKALAGFPALVQAWSAGLPFGFWSFLLAVAIGMGVWGFLYLHSSMCSSRPHSCADTAAVVTGLAVDLAQQVVSGNVTPGAMLNALWLGLFAGLLAMYLARLLWSLFSSPKDSA